MAGTLEAGRRSRLGERQTWCLDSLQPKLLDAASAGTVAPAAAALLERQLWELLEFAGHPREEAG